MMIKTFPALFFLLLFCFVAKAQKSLLQLNLRQGATYHIISSSNLKTIQTINGQPLQVELSIAGKTLFTVTHIRDSLYNMTVRYDSLAIKMELPIGTINANSEGGAKDIYSGILSKLKSKPFSLVLSKTGRVSSVNGIDSLINAITESFAEIPQEQRAQAMQQVLQLLGAKAFKGSLELLTRICPTYPVAANDKWVTDTKTEMPVPLNVHALYVLRPATGTVYSIEGTAIINTENNGAGAQLNEMPVKYNLAGNMKILLRANKKTGWVTEARIDQSVKGNLEIKDNPKLPGGMLIPMSITGNTVIGE